jgi:hypothetical protein
MQVGSRVKSADVAWRGSRTTGNLRFARRGVRSSSGWWARTCHSPLGIGWRGGAGSGWGGAQVSAKAQRGGEFLVGWIDSLGGWRYSQAQIPDLVAHAIPRFHLRAPSFGSVLLDGGSFLEKTIEISVSRCAGAKAHGGFGRVRRGLKPSSPSELNCGGAKARVYFGGFSAWSKTTFGSSVAPTGLIDFDVAFPGRRFACPGLFSTAPSGSNWPDGSAGFSAPSGGTAGFSSLSVRLKPRAFKNDNLTSTHKRRTGGSRFL